jgi:hypothetical protein
VSDCVGSGVSAADVRIVPVQSQWLADKHDWRESCRLRKVTNVNFISEESLTHHHLRVLRQISVLISYQGKLPWGSSAFLFGLWIAESARTSFFWVPKCAIRQALLFCLFLSYCCPEGARRPIL